jgi:hypothetical protein
MLILVGAVAAQGAEVYRSTDPNGNVRYSDRPLNESSKPVFVASLPHAARSAPAARGAAQPNEETAKEPAKPGDPNRGIQAETTSPEQQAEIKAKNCQVAQQRKQSYAEAHRLFKTDANGQRVYLSDSEIDQARARAEADVHTWCD